MQAVIELALERPLKLGMVEVPGVKLEVVGVDGHGWIFEIYQDFNTFPLGPGGKFEQRMFVEIQLGKNTFEPRVWKIGHRMILRAFPHARRDWSELWVVKPSCQIAVPSCQLFVAQGFDGIKLGGFDGG
jgi:hypothetical protein